MFLHKLSSHIFVYVVVATSIHEAKAYSDGSEGIQRVLYSDKGIKPHFLNHVHNREVPCDVCPRNGKCVMNVQCPAHVRPGSHNPLCHLPGGMVGICCFTSTRHAAELDQGVRSSGSMTVDDIKKAQNESRREFLEWVDIVEKLEKRFNETLLNVTTPSFAHFLSTTSHNTKAEELGRGALLNLFATKHLKARQALSDHELALGLTDHADGPFCPPLPFCPVTPSRFRSIGGECNNKNYPTWGAIHSGFEKLLPPAYSDGIWAMRNSVVGIPLPSARTVSNALLPDDNHPSPTYNLMFMQFGQFIAHDVSAGVIFTMGNGSAISCCRGDGEDFLPPELMHGACAPIVVDPTDPFFSKFGYHCMNFVRTQLAPAPHCSVGYAKQMNGVSHFLDLSHIYGNTVEKMATLRAPGGLLMTFNDYGRQLPPLTTKNDCLTMNKGGACFDSGDNHGNQIISLTVLHTIWTREHNRVANALSRLNPDWSADTIFMETRRIVQAEFQHIVYNEWLPLLIGSKLHQAFGLMPSQGYSSCYDPKVNPSLTAEFSTAAMRFGHSVVDGKLDVPNLEKGGIQESIFIPEVMLQPSRMRLRPFLDQLLAGLMWQPMQNVDPFVSESLTRYLFHGGNPYGLDLASINIQRGRDYGVRPYNAYRILCGLQPFVEFRQFHERVAKRLSSVYSSPEDIDLWIGGLLEEPVEGGVVGHTFAHIIADQFSRLKKGDQYFYEYGPEVNPGAFTPSQLAEIKKVTLSRIICDNRDGIRLQQLPPKAFLKPDLPGNEPISCDSHLIPSMDLSRFKEI